ncbi:MAG: aquaporin [Candidatus Gastranaerophilales bacterium]|nr:aquaporin [Candidatus Gastranaerophilales bacterium]
MIQNMKKYLVEVIGTFFLVLTIACTGLIGAEGVIAPLAIGSVLMVMVYAGGHISGGHYNPAVSLAACIRGALEKSQLIPYIIAQVIGGVLAVCIFKLMAGYTAVEPPAVYSVKALLIAEFLFTFALCYVVLQTATAKNTAGNSYYGLAIGFTVLAGAFSVGGSLCAGAFNPAVAISAGLMNMTTWTLAGYTILANLIAGVCAAIIFKMVYTEE